MIDYDAIKDYVVENVSVCAIALAIVYAPEVFAPLMANPQMVLNQ